MLVGLLGIKNQHRFPNFVRIIMESRHDLEKYNKIKARQISTSNQRDNGVMGSTHKI